LKSGDLDKRLSAYLDGALENAKRERLEREIERDPALQKQLRRTQSLGSLVRESWSEGPAAPAPEFLIATLRPQIAAIARERRARPSWQRGLELARMQFVHWFGPTPLVASAAAAFLVALAILPRATGPIPDMTGGPIVVAPASAPALTSRHHAGFSPVVLSPEPAFSRDAAAGVYDVAPGENPAMLFQNEDGSTSLWLLDDDDLSLRMQQMDRWG
jgi:anti-sigma factor RsiW